MSGLTQPMYNILLLACKRNERERSRSFVLQCHPPSTCRLYFITAMLTRRDAAVAAAFTTCGKGSFYIFWSHLK